MKRTIFVALVLIAVLAIPCVSAQSAGARASAGILRPRSSPAETQSKLQSPIERPQNGTVANQELQSLLEKQQQTLQMLSNISKTLNDTARNTIRKLRG
jgi:hypothetical protein